MSLSKDVGLNFNWARLGINRYNRSWVILIFLLKKKFPYRYPYLIPQSNRWFDEIFFQRERISRFSKLCGIATKFRQFAFGKCEFINWFDVKNNEVFTIRLRRKGFHVKICISKMYNCAFTENFKIRRLKSVSKWHWKWFH